MWIWMVLVAVLIVWWMYARAAASVGGTHRLAGAAFRGGALEGFADYLDSAATSPGGLEPDIADIRQPLPLSDFLQEKPGLQDLTAGSCAGVDATRQTELGGQYVQRTNNYRRDYPDNCSAPLSEFVGSVYTPTAVGATVPCTGQC